MNKKTWIGLIVIVVAILIVFLAVKHDKPKLEEVIKIGAPLALTGDAAVWGEAEKNAMEMAVEEINASGGVKGKALELVIEDMKSGNQPSVSAVSKLLTVDKVPYIIGPTWADSYQAAIPLSDQYNTIFLNSSAAITSVHTGGQFFKNFFSAYYRSDFQGKNYLNTIGKENLKSLYILVQNDPYYTDFTSYIEQRAKELGAKVSVNKVPIHTVDFRTKLLEIKNEKPDVVFVGFGSDQEFGALYRQRAELGLQNIPFYNPEMIAEFGPKPEYRDILKNTYYVGFEPMPAEFSAKYKKKFGIDPVFSASIAYDTVYILKNALEHTDGSTEAIRNYLESETFDTVTFNKTGFDDIHGIKETELKLYGYDSELGDYKIVE